MEGSGGSPRERLGAALKGLLEESGLSLREAVEIGGGFSLGVTTLREWRDGKSAPAAGKEAVFRELVRKLEAAAGRAALSAAEWEDVLRAARAEAVRRKRAGHFLRGRDAEDKPFVRAHLPELRAREGLVGRGAERKVMRDFVRASGPGAEPYLCWQAESAVGKTALLADWVERPPQGVDLLNFFVSKARGTDTCAAFVAEMGEQLRAFPGLGERSVPDSPDPRQWAAFFNSVTAESGRKLLLVVDGLDEDVAWGGPGRSIAALLPVRPDADLRIIVSARRSTPVPGDLPAAHPLRSRRHFRVLGPSARAAEIGRANRVREVARLGASGPGRRVLGLLAAAGEGLRAVDLAEVAGVPAEGIERVLQDADGHRVLLEDPVAGTYALGHADVLRSVREELGPVEMARHTGLLHTWAGAWRTAGWPEETPPYLLTGYARLLDDPVRRGEYVLDARRQTRLAARAGHEAVLAQVEAVGEGFDAEATGPDATGPEATGPEELARAARRAVSVALLRGGARRVEALAPVLLVRLGEVDRARALARSAPGPVVRAARLARVAVEVGRTGRPGAAAIAEEAARWAGRADRGLPRPPRDADAYAELAEAAHALLAVDETGAARALLRAVVLGGEADVETLVAAARVLSEGDDRDWVAAVDADADRLSSGDARARAAAVEIWATIARGLRSHRVHARSRIVALCEELDPVDGPADGPADGLAAVDVRALAACALARGTKRAPGLLRAALDQLSAALADPAALSPADRAHLRRDISTTLERLGRAVHDTGAGRDSLARLGELVAKHREELRTGVLGDDLAERAEANIAAAEERGAAADAAYREREKERRREERRNKDAGREAMRRLREGKPAVEPEPKPKPVRSRPSPRERPRAHPVPDGDGHEPEHLVLLRRSERSLRDGDLAHGRELLETAIRSAPPVRGPAAGDGWTPALFRGLGSVGEFGEAERLVRFVTEPGSRARHLAALSLGCALGGEGEAAGWYAREAAWLVGDDGLDPVTRRAVAQALAHAGEEAGAEEMARRTVPGEKGQPEIRRSLALVAAGLARRAPGTAARLVEPVVEALERRAGTGSPVGPLPRLAELLLTLPDVRRPGPRLRGALEAASAFVERPRQQWDPRAVVVLVLLVRLGCCPERADRAEAADEWLRTLPGLPGLPAERIPYAELAVLRAVEGDTAEARRLALAAPARGGRRAAASAAVATRLAGVPVVLPADRAPEEDSTVRLCLALAHAAGDGTAPAEEAARALVRELLAGEGWACAVPLLSRLAPRALVPIGEMVRAYGIGRLGPPGPWEPLS
ncbi:hypothetical protein GCM10010232_56700 [Streptomyces amakusaensis]|uniref:NACHT domain-containing protein n=1 Tax=Streptomyces amakusaensis TaxID=67271 RepID=A0ABW0ANU3_9ACTN